MEELSLCRICNQSFKRNGLGVHISRIHNVSFKKYVKRFIDKFPEDFPYWRLRENGKLVRYYSTRYKKYKKVREDSDVECLICNKIIGSHGIGFHIKKLHNINNYEDYVEEFIDNFPENFTMWQRCRICDKVSMKKCCSRECDSRWRSENLVGENATRYGAILSEKTKQKIGQKAKERFKNKENHPMYGKVHSYESIEKMSKSAKKRCSDPDYINPMKGKNHSPESIKKIFSYRQMNELEKLVGNILKENNIDYYFQFFITENEICKSYDFKIKGKPLLIEIDGDYWHGGPGHKYEEFYNVSEVKKNDKLKNKIAEKRGYKVIRIWESEIKENPNIILEKICSTKT